MPKPPVQTRTYPQLLKAIRAEIESGKKIILQTKANTYRNVGDYILDYILHGADRAKYGARIFEKLAKDLGISQRVLEDVVRIAREFPIPPKSAELTWSHYRTLLRVDGPARKALFKKAVTKNLKVEDLEKEIGRRKKIKIDPAAPVPQLKFTRGKLNIYKIVKSNKSLAGRGPLAIDLGFREQEPFANTENILINANGRESNANSREFDSRKLALDSRKFALKSSIKHFKEEDTIELLFKDGKASGIKKVEVAKDEMFTYQAMVEKVIDGDTLLISFDFSLGRAVSQKLRLRGIDCPEMDTEEGKKAKRFVESRLKDCEFIRLRHKTFVWWLRRDVARISLTEGG